MYILILIEKDLTKIINIIEKKYNNLNVHTKIVSHYLMNLNNCGNISCIYSELKSDKENLLLRVSSDIKNILNDCFSDEENGMLRFQQYINSNNDIDWYFDYLYNLSKKK